MTHYYTETIPYELGLRLEKVGMPVEFEINELEEHPLTPDKHCLTTYAEVMDWLMSKDWRIILSLYHYEEPVKWGFSIWTMDGYRIDESCEKFATWHDAVNAAIGRAIEMVEEEK